MDAPSSPAQGRADSNVDALLLLQREGDVSGTPAPPDLQQVGALGTRRTFPGVRLHPVRVAHPSRTG